MAAPCQKHRSRTCEKCRAAGDKKDANTAICSGKCRRTFKINRMKRWQGDLYCVTCHADSTTVKCSECGRQRETQYVVRIGGRLICSWCR